MRVPRLLTLAAVTVGSLVQPALGAEGDGGVISPGSVEAARERPTHRVSCAWPDVERGERASFVEQVGPIVVDRPTVRRRDGAVVLSVSQTQGRGRMRVDGHPAVFVAWSDKKCEVVSEPPPVEVCGTVQNARPRRTRAAASWRNSDGRVERTSAPVLRDGSFCLTASARPFEVEVARRDGIGAARYAYAAMSTHRLGIHASSVDLGALAFELPAEPKRSTGLLVEPVGGEGGFVVTHVAAGSPGARSGLVSGDRLLAVETSSPRSVVVMLRSPDGSLLEETIPLRRIRWQPIIRSSTTPDGGWATTASKRSTELQL